MESSLRADAAKPGLKLIETVLWDGVACPRLSGHLDRLTRSAALLGWPCDAAAVTQTLRGPAGQAARMRLTLDATGALDLTTAALPPAIAVWRLGLATVRMQAQDPWLGVKSTRRATYDTARAALPTTLDEVIFLNQRGEVTEGTITNLFFDRGQGLRTPPIGSGLLPGVLRAELMCQNCVEEVLLADDLPRVRLWVGNALRGLCPAIWAV